MWTILTGKKQKNMKNLCLFKKEDLIRPQVLDKQREETSHVKSLSARLSQDD